MNPNASESLIHGHCPACGTIQPVRGTLVEPHMNTIGELAGTRCEGSGMMPRSYIRMLEPEAPAFVPGGGRRF